MLEEYSKEYYPLLPFCVVAGGKERQDSVANAVSAKARMPVKDTIKVVDENNLVQYTPVRSTLRAVQTPQIFKISILKQAYELFRNSMVM